MQPYLHSKPAYCSVAFRITPIHTVPPVYIGKTKCWQKSLNCLRNHPRMMLLTKFGKSFKPKQLRTPWFRVHECLHSLLLIAGVRLLLLRSWRRVPRYFLVCSTEQYARSSLLSCPENEAKLIWQNPICQAICQYLMAVRYNHMA